ncbi:MAG: restriction endonuclease subunit S [Bacteroidales bacterium]|nr:restriction endonuclease subunit S [Bacteroidales bacterium]
MSKIEELIKKHCPNGVEYIPIGQLISRVREKGKNNPDIQTVYAISNKLGVVKSSDYHDFEIHSSDTSNYVVLRKGNFAYNPARLNIGSIAYLQTNEAGLVSPMYVVFQINEKLITQEYLFLVIKSQRVISLINGLTEEGARFRFDFERWNKISIPLPPLPVQEEIVRILDKFTTLEAELQAELEARRKQYEYYRDKLLNVDCRMQNVEWKKLGNIGKVCMCKRILKQQTSAEGDIPFFKIGTFGGEADAYISRELFELYKSKYSYPKKGDVLISAAGTIGRTIVFDGEPAYFQDSNIVWLKHDETVVLNSYLRYCYSMNPWAVSTGGTIARLYNDNILNAVIPVPPLPEQERIVSILDRFDTLVNDISQGLPAEIEARKKQYEYYRDKLLTFRECRM